jgi:serine/threonine protein kinase
MGTLSYMPPELLRSSRLSAAADIYAFGILLWECYSGRSAFAGLHFGEIYQAVALEGLRPPPPKGAPAGYALLMRACWAQEPAERPSFAAIVHCLDLLAREAAAAAAAAGGSGAGSAGAVAAGLALPAGPPAPLPALRAVAEADEEERAEQEEQERRPRGLVRDVGVVPRPPPPPPPPLPGGAQPAAPPSGGSGLVDRASSLLHVRDL